MNIQSIQPGLAAAPVERKSTEVSSSQTATKPLSLAEVETTKSNAAAAQKTDQATADKQLQKAVQNLRDAVEPLARDLRFSVDKDTGQTVVKIIDSSTDDVIRQIPSEEALAIAKELGEYTKSLGVLVTQKA